MPTTRKETNTPRFNMMSSKDMYMDRSLIAFVIDGEIVEILNTNKKLSAILQSDPVIVELDAEKQFIDGPHIGWKYDGNNFIAPNID
jgi:hypothetical protein